MYLTRLLSKTNPPNGKWTRNSLQIIMSLLLCNFKYYELKVSNGILSSFSLPCFCLLKCLAMAQGNIDSMNVVISSWPAKQVQMR